MGATEWDGHEKAEGRIKKGEGRKGEVANIEHRNT
jgi:hypothetical protein